MGSFLLSLSSSLWLVPPSTTYWCGAANRYVTTDSSFKNYSRMQKKQTYFQMKAWDALTGLAVGLSFQWLKWLHKLYSLEVKHPHSVWLSLSVSVFYELYWSYINITQTISQTWSEWMICCGNQSINQSKCQKGTDTEECARFLSIHFNVSILINLMNKWSFSLLVM